MTQPQVATQRKTASLLLALHRPLGRMRPTPEMIKFIQPRRLALPPASEDAAFARPSFDRHDGSAAIDLEVYLPAVESSGIEVRIDQRELLVTACHPHRPRSNFAGAPLEERLRDYRLRAHLGSGIELGDVTVDFVDGVLRIHLPTVQAARPWQLAVT